MLHNTGQSLVFRVDKEMKQHVNISGGPLAYRYQFEEIYIHYGTENQQGSEHHIHGYSFPAEVSLHLSILFAWQFMENSECVRLKLSATFGLLSSIWKLNSNVWDRFYIAYNLIFVQLYVMKLFCQICYKVHLGTISYLIYFEINYQELLIFHSID